MEVEAIKAQWERQCSALRNRCHSVRETSERVKDELIINRLRQDRISQETAGFVTGITNKNSLPNLPAGSEWIT
jgi:hypothetical protein